MNLREPSQAIDRRAFIGRLAVGGAIVGTYPLLGAEPAEARPSRWSDPGTWKGNPPGKNDVAVISRPVLLDTNASVGGVVIEKRGALIFAPRKRVRLTSTGNVIVHGLLDMRPDGARKRHSLTFAGVDESRYKGGGKEPIDSDVGLWVMGGLLRLAGAPKRAWTRAAGGLKAGTRTVELRADPKGWRVGDELVITPTLPPSNSDHATAFDRASIVRIKGHTVTLSKDLEFDHPDVKTKAGQMTAEVLNLSRNVVIEGTPQGRAHIFIHSSRRQTIKNIDVRHMGPRRPSEDDGRYTEKILGRWGLHFHHAGHGSHRSVVRGVVVRNSGSHAFVPHVSHGVIFRGCIAYNNLETPFWWDEPTKDDPSDTDDTVYDSCVAALAQFDPPHRGGSRLMGFKLAQGQGNTIRNCVAVGVLGQGGGDSAGFGWIAHEWGVWDLQDCTSHNNHSLGSRFWLNDPAPHEVKGLIAYHNGRYGSFDGAYANAVDYIGCTYHRNGDEGIHAKATCSENDRSSKVVNGCSFDQAGETDYCIQLTGHVNDPEGKRVLIRGCDFSGARKAALGFTNDASGNTSVPDLVDIVNCKFDGNEFWLGNKIDPRSRIRVQDPKHGAIQLSRRDQLTEGDLVPRWNARVKKIRSFA